MLARAALAVLVGALLALNALAPPAWPQPPKREMGEAQWIWLPNLQQRGVAYFRKMFAMRQPVFGQVEITCEDRYELFVNGRRVGAGDNWRVLNRHDVTKYLVSGRNVVAVRAEKKEGAQGAAGMVARVLVRDAGGTFVSQSSNASWKTAAQEFPRWNWVNFNDLPWPPAGVLGEFGRTPPWENLVRPADGSSGSRFKTLPDFRVERVVPPHKCGSLVAMTFDEWGNILAAREGGPLLLIEDRDKDDVLETVVPFCKKITNCQGVLAINRDVFAVGKGPQGAGLYRLIDKDGDAKAETTEMLVQFSGGINEHGPHALTLGPDGWIYMVIGNHAGMKAKPAASSPYHHHYEGDLVQPRYEDAGGHAHGVKAPGGVIVRLTVDGRNVELFAGGLRNPYDLCFNRDGELFTYDSDMEWDEGLPWYRPTRLLHLVPGAEFGWRSGWAKWPEYYLDNLPAVLHTGRGSPTGMVLYDHVKYPDRYHGAMFLCDWTMGRILSVTMRRAHGSYKGTSEIFLEGKPLNVTDAAVGPDGWLYLCTGGRGTEGGVYRVVYDGKSPFRRKLAGIGRAIRQPQFHSAFARDKVAAVQEEMGDQWDAQITNLVADARAQPRDRMRAMELMHLYGPPPSTRLLVQLSRDHDPHVRAKAATLMGQHFDDSTYRRLLDMLRDTDPTVRRRTCEALSRAGQKPPVDRLLPLLADENRFVTWAGRRLLQRSPIANWQDAALRATDPRTFNNSAAALLAMTEDPDAARSVLEGAGRTIAGYVGDDDFVDLVRVIQLALHRGGLTRDDMPEKLMEQLAEEFPALTTKNPVGGRRINRELVRLLSALQEESVAGRFAEQLRAREPIEEQVHLAVHARFVADGWTTEQKFELLDFYERARAMNGGYSLSRYIDNVAGDFVAKFTPQEKDEVLRLARRWPTSSLGVLKKLPPDPGEDLLARLRDIDAELDNIQGEPARRLQTGIVAVLARSRDEQAMDYLRALWKDFPERRPTVAMGLAQSPGAENWPLLIRSLPILDGPAAVEVLRKLRLVGGGPPEKQEAIRQVIICGLRLREQGAKNAIELLEYWFEDRLTKPHDPWHVSLKAWQEWYAREFPKAAPATLPKESGQSKWSFHELLGHLKNTELKGDPRRGVAVFTKALCIKCHRFGNRGEAIGPDLTTVSRRFQKREVLESILFPSQVISDQYASKTVVTEDGRQFTGIVGAAGPDAIMVLLTSGEKMRIERNFIAQILPAKQSAMPEGLLNHLTLEEILDLFAYLYDSPGGRFTRRGPNDVR